MTGTGPRGAATISGGNGESGRCEWRRRSAAAGRGEGEDGSRGAGCGSNRWRREGRSATTGTGARMAPTVGGSGGEGGRCLWRRRSAGAGGAVGHDGDGGAGGGNC